MTKLLGCNLSESEEDFGQTSPCVIFVHFTTLFVILNLVIILLEFCCEYWMDKAVRARDQWPDGFVRVSAAAATTAVTVPSPNLTEPRPVKSWCVALRPPQDGDRPPARLRLLAGPDPAGRQRLGSTVVWRMSSHQGGPRPPARRARSPPSPSSLSPRRRDRDRNGCWASR